MVSQAFPIDSALSQAENAVSQASPADSTLSQAESTVSQAGIPLAGPVVRCSARLWALHASQSNNSQAVSSQAGNTPCQTVLTLSQLVRLPSWDLPWLMFPRQLVALVPRKQGLPPTNRHSSSQYSSPREEPNPKWAINLSSKPLTNAQRSVLAKGPNFAVSPKHPPNLEYITAIEATCTKLSQQNAEELRADINQVLRASHPPSPI